jgi:hypothetical protein
MQLETSHRLIAQDNTQDIPKELCVKHTYTHTYTSLTNMLVYVLVLLHVHTYRCAYMIKHRSAFSVCKLS